MKPLLLIALTSIAFDLQASAISYISLADAVKQGLLKVECSGQNGVDDEGNDSGSGIHSGRCIKLTATNISGRSLNIRMETGRTLSPTDTGVQAMVVTEMLAFSIPANAKQEHLLYAMCTEMTDSGPDADDAFTLGLMANTDVRGMAELIEKYHAQNETGQDALWVITDDLELSAIDGDDSEMVAALRKYAAEVTGKTITPAETPESHYTVPLFAGAVEFGYRILRSSKVSLIIVDPEGIEFKKLMSDQNHEPGVYSVRYTLEGSGMAPGVYTVKLFQDGSFVSFKQFRIE